MVDALLSAVRRAPDRVLGHLRRAAVRAAVAEGPAPAHILVVCHGNICRSPFARAILQRRLGNAGVVVESAGFIGPGRRPPPAAIRAAQRRHVNLSVHRSALVATPAVQRAGLVVAMDAQQARALRVRFGEEVRRVVLLGDFDPHPHPVEGRAIADPWDQPDEVFDEVYARIERCAAGLADAVLAAWRRGTSAPA